MRQQVVENGIHNFTGEENYRPPKEPAVAEHVKWFMGLKLGLMMHWSPGSQLGTYESWPLSDGDGSWSQEDVDWTDIETFKQQYIRANRTFNPVKFRPDRWAKLAKDCGFKYLLFTTKHHDGFCMFDTDTTDYKITDPSCPFHTSPRADIAGALFEEFRRQGLAISAYFSKPDWHSDSYWHKEFGPAPSRNVNYQIDEHPELWEDFVRYTHRQIGELCSRYGKIDVLWLDGGWVTPDNSGQDIRLGEIVGKLRSTTQPHLIVCDRCAGGEFENIVTPEKTVPDHPMLIPWETCTTLGNHFSFHYHDQFKDGRQLVHLLLDIVSKGGNLALNVAPQPDGALPAGAVSSLKQLGAWLSIHGDGIYHTTAVSPYQNRSFFYTRKNDVIYAFYRYKELPALPEILKLPIEEQVTSARLMRTGDELDFISHPGFISILTKPLSMNGAFYADCFVLTVS